MQGERPSKPDYRAIAAKAALAVVDDGVTRKAADGRFGIGRKRLTDAIARLRAERAAGGRP